LLLVQYPEWQERLFVELQLGKDTKLLQHFILECLRLYPPVPIDIKEAAVDDVLPGGYFIPKGTRITFEPYVMARLPQFWGADCLEFRPERWGEMKSLPSPYEFPTFQAGPRICLGESMAKLEAHTLLKKLIVRYKFAMPNGMDPFQKTYKMGVTMKVKDGLELMVTKRV
jgi:cytochrome P450